MKRISNIKVEPLTQNKFIQPIQIIYNQNGKEKKWEAIISHDSVAVLLYHRKKDSFLLVKQFRPPVYINNKTHGYTYELCAGILDKKLSKEQTIIEEIDEECGYSVDIKKIEKIASFYTSVGVAGSKQSLYYAEIDESMKIHDGGGIHDEEIELFFLPLSKARKFIWDETIPKTQGVLFSFFWFLDKQQSKKAYYL